MILRLMPKHTGLYYNGKKVPIIPPLPINNKLISDFEVKVMILMIFLHHSIRP